MSTFRVNCLRKLFAPLLAATLLSLLPSDAHAQIVTLSTTVHDAYRNTGAFRGVGGYATGDPTNDAFEENRSYVVFDLGPNTDPIAAATLRLYNPPTGFGTTQGPTEDLTIFDVTTPIASLTAGTGGLAAFIDLGTGTAYGVRTVSTLDNNTFIDIILNPAAVAALNSSSGQFAFGAAITTLDPGFVGEQEEVFRSTEGPIVLFLDLVAVPEPSSILLSCIGVAAAALKIRRRRGVAAVSV